MNQNKRPWEIEYKEARKFGLTRQQLKQINRTNKLQYINNGWHEAAHVVVGDALGLPAQFIDLTPHISEVIHGRAMLTVADVKQRQPTRLESIAALNGDKEAIDLIERHLITAMGGIVYDLWNGHFGGGMDIWDMVSRCINLYKGDTDKCVSIVKKSATKAAKILDTRFAVLSKLANTAIEEHMLDELEINTVLKMDLPSVHMGFIKHAEINLIFRIESGVEPRCQIVLLDYDENEGLTPPYNVDVLLDTTMFEEIVHRFELEK